jgi:Sec-independent protein translocase protein TatA
MPSIGPLEIIIVLVVLLLVFGKVEAAEKTPPAAER